MGECWIPADTGFHIVENAVFIHKNSVSTVWKKCENAAFTRKAALPPCGRSQWGPGIGPTFFAGFLVYVEAPLKTCSRGQVKYIVFFYKNEKDAKPLKI